MAGNSFIEHRMEVIAKAFDLEAWPTWWDP